jgi:hypothetical protein
MHELGWRKESTVTYSKRAIIFMAVLLAVSTTTATRAQLTAGKGARVTRAATADGSGLEWWIYQDIVISGMETQYEEARKELVTMLHKDNITSSEFTLLAMKSDQNACVAYTAPTGVRSGGSDAPVLSINWLQAYTKLGPAYVEAYKRMRALTRGTSEFLIRFRPDLSYVPATPKWPAQEQTFIKDEYNSIMPDSKEEFEGVMKQLASLQQEKGLTVGFKVFEVLIGPEKPMYLVTSGGPTQAELNAQLTADRKILGAGGEALVDHARRLTAKYEAHDDTVRLDLSYFPGLEQ